MQTLDTDLDFGRHVGAAVDRFAFFFAAVILFALDPDLAGCAGEAGDGGVRGTLPRIDARGERCGSRRRRPAMVQYRII